MAEKGIGARSTGAPELCALLSYISRSATSTHEGVGT
jgi:hypothetical protein